MEHLTDDQLGKETRRILYLKTGTQSRMTLLIGLQNKCEPPSGVMVAPKAPKAVVPKMAPPKPVVPTAAFKGATAAEPEVVRKTTRKKKAAKKA